MNIIIPMAGMGKRMRPHTLTTPKPLLPVAGKPIVQHLAEGIAGMGNSKVEEIAFIVGHFGEAVEQQLLEIARKLGARGRICYQEEPLGTAHAILCAKEQLTGPVIVALADTLFYADFNLDMNQDGIIWVQRIPDPSQFGVVKLDAEGLITDFIEKPKDFISDLAIIGIYYFADGENLRKELQYLLDNDIKEKGEYQLTTALENMKKHGKRFRTAEVLEWLDCGNKDATVFTNQRVLEHMKDEQGLIAPDVVLDNSVVIPPCFIAPGVVLKNSVIGPYVSIGAKTVIEDSVISNAILLNNGQLRHQLLCNTMTGQFVTLVGRPAELSLGDYNTLVS